ncbi:MAG: alpha/beta hydrolase [Burkholderiaceae bacterium]|nr:alpha/beta hydrolase [Burkholderiaceae bacterium]
MARIVVAHGAWSSAFAWQRMHALLRERGHTLWVPTLTGLGERSHLSNRSIDLDMHVRDVCNMLFHEDLNDIVLIGHSYGGMVATGVADREPARIRRLVYLDAFAPRDGDSLLGLLPEPARARMLELARSEGDGWRIPSNPLPDDTSPEDVAWLTPRRHPQPIETFRQPIRLAKGEPAMPRHYVYCTKIAPGDVFGRFAARARTEGGWGYDEIDASHNPHVTVPDALAELIDRMAS